MPYCCAYQCQNRDGSGKRFYKFPRSEKRKKVWVNMVNRKDWRPSKSSVLCSDHFSNEAFVTPPHIYASLNLKRNLRLKPNAVPTIFPHKTPAPNRHSKAVAKRDQLRVSIKKLLVFRGSKQI